ncbi:MAG: biotin-dependent carboxyltransferase family protein [Candidatus Cyclobacteriaceae bacterium M2_1C_046]
MIEVISPGLLTTIQDLGRENVRRFGVPQSGAMDEYNAFLANWLVNNNEGSPLLEFTMTGPSLKFNSSCTIGIAGADMGAKLNDAPISNYTSVSVSAGDVLDFTQARSGFRTYLSVKGGFSAEEFLNSYSTYTLANIGGYNGRALKKGDVLNLSAPEITDGKTVPEHVQTKFNLTRTIRIIEGPEYELISEDSPMGLAGNYKIHMNSDRMGIRLTGFIGEVSEKEIISSAVNKGTIQLLPDNDLIVLMSDGQVSGGYPRLGNVISADIHLLAQCRPGEQVKLLPVSLDEAVHLWSHQCKLLKALG